MSSRRYTAVRAASVVAQEVEEASIDDLMGVLKASSKTNKYLERRRNGN